MGHPNVIAAMAGELREIKAELEQLKALHEKRTTELLHANTREVGLRRCLTGLMRTALEEMRGAGWSEGNQQQQGIVAAFAGVLG